MKKFGTYWKKNKKWIGSGLGGLIIFIAVLLLSGIPAAPMKYAFVLCCGVEVVFLAADFSKYYGKCRRMEEQYINIDICIPKEEKPEDLVEMYYQEMVETLFQGKLKIESESSIAKKELLDYYSLWVHQIKTPIAAGWRWYSLLLTFQSIMENAGEWRNNTSILIYAFQRRKSQKTW